MGGEKHFYTTGREEGRNSETGGQSLYSEGGEEFN